ncbi:MAG: hypothetical protein ACRD0Y_11480 [Terriglobales bacterium]
MKATVEIDNTLLRQVRRIATEFGFTLRELAEPGLQREIAVPARAGHRVELPVSRSRWPEGLDISSREKMWEWIEAEPREDQL